MITATDDHRNRRSPQPPITATADHRNRSAPEKAPGAHRGQAD
jgi:hypothetical protein